MVAYIQAPTLQQGSDEDLIIEMGAIVFPDFVQRNPGANGLRLKLEGDYKDDSLLKPAADQFQVLLGVLRAWRPLAGQRVDEVWPGIGAGSIRDEHGSQLVMVGPAIEYRTSVSEVEACAREAKLASECSPHLRNALWLNGRRDRNAADFYMVYEYAEADFAGRKAIVAALGVTNIDIRSLRNSANNLAPFDGGRHANGSGIADWGLDVLREFIARFLKSWIAYRARNAP
ncbi:MAG: hypothetical protein ACKVQT_08020 [Burkholderiales bacterium]